MVSFQLYGFGGAIYATVALVFVLALVDSWSVVRPQSHGLHARGEEPAPARPQD